MTLLIYYYAEIGYHRLAALYVHTARNSGIRLKSEVFTYYFEQIFGTHLCVCVCIMLMRVLKYETALKILKNHLTYTRHIKNTLPKACALQLITLIKSFNNSEEECLIKLKIAYSYLPPLYGPCRR